MADTTLQLDSVRANPAAFCDRVDNLVVLPRTFPGASADISAAAELVRTSFFGPNGADAWNEGERRLAEIPARNHIDIAVKVAHGLFEVAPAPHGDRLAVDLSGLVCDTVGDLLLSAFHDLTCETRAENPALVAAFQSFCASFADLKAAPIGADEAPFYAVMDLADDAMRDQAALTPAGVAMKLKRVFVSFVGKQWSDHALLDQRPSDFEDNVRASDLYQEMLWRAIEDLERMSPPRGATDSGVWDAALAEYRKAWALWDELTGEYTHEESNAVAVIAIPALDTMIETPVPSAAALVTKIEEMRRAERQIDDDDLAAILADARYLAAREA